MSPTSAVNADQLIFGESARGLTISILVDGGTTATTLPLPTKTSLPPSLE